VKKLIFVAVAVALTVAACSSSSKTTNNNAATTTTAHSPSGAAAPPQTGNPTSAVTLTTSGSTLLLPYLQTLAGPLHSAYPNITLQPTGGGSGKGISDAIAGTVTMGGSDAYLSAAQRQQNPGLSNIPIAVSSQSVDYNLSGVSTPLHLTGNVIAQMYQGTIKTWNAPQIAQLNPGVNLPSTAVVPVRRVDSSGDTFIFTSFLTATNQQWNAGPNLGTTVNWPAVTGELTANGNPGMVQTCSSTPGCIAYIGISAQASATAAHLGQAMLQAKDGQYVAPTQANVLNAVNNSTSNVPANLAASLIYAPGANSYPIVNFEYMIVKTSQPDTNTAGAIRTFLSWAISPTGGATPANLAKQSFVALPNSVIPKVNTAISAIH
jgi:phosphate transport system substrate-binding protein